MAQLYYDTNVHALTAVLATFSTACFGYGVVGLFRPLTVYPSEMVYWTVRNPASQSTSDGSLQLLHRTYRQFLSFRVRDTRPKSFITDLHAALHFDTKSNQKRVKLFWIAFAGMFIYEVFPSYIFPLLNGFSIVCLATQHAPTNTLNIITNLFGGSNGNEGLGYVTLHFYLNVPAAYYVYSFLSLGFDWQYITST